MKIRMTADSTCDLSPDLLHKYDVGIAPLSVIIDGEVFHDGVDVTPRDVFRAAEAGKSGRTAAVNTYEYREFFTEQLKTCDQLVHICISSEFSTCYSDALEASREMDNVLSWTAGTFPPAADCWCWKARRWPPAAWKARRLPKP